MAASTPTLLLHGFAQDSSVWDGVARRIGSELIVPDIPGHGAMAAVAPASLAHVIEGIIGRLPSQPVIACGYSMGGRIALELAVTHPELVSGLVMVSSTAGIESIEERQARAVSDESLARLLEERGIEVFSEMWEGLPLWHGDPVSVRLAARSVRLRQNPRGLAAALRALGPSATPARWSQLAHLRVPVRLMVGSRDQRYLEINRRMRDLVAGSELLVLDDAGHSLPLERPDQVGDAIAVLRG